MTVTFAWWAVPIAILFVSLIVSMLVDGREMLSSEMMSGCLGFSILAAGTLIAIGVTIGHLL